jgi:hypothetical protein
VRKPDVALGNAAQRCNHPLMALVSAGNRLLVVAAAVAGAALAWYSVVRTVSDVRRVSVGAVPTASAIAWGDRVFTTRLPLAAWLRHHGVAYVVWADRHPGVRQTIARWK